MELQESHVGLAVDDEVVAGQGQCDVIWRMLMLWKTEIHFREDSSFLTLRARSSTKSCMV